MKFIQHAVEVTADPEFPGTWVTIDADERIVTVVFRREPQDDPLAEAFPVSPLRCAG